jgi:hypothetical protein
MPTNKQDHGLLLSPFLTQKQKFRNCREFLILNGRLRAKIAGTEDTPAEQKSKKQKKIFFLFFPFRRLLQRDGGGE